MVDFPEKISRQSAALAAGVLLTLVALVAHRFLPERRLTLDPAQKGAVFYLTKGEETLTQVDWIDQSRVHFKCHFARDASGASCGYTYELFRDQDIAHGADLSRFHKLTLTVRYAGSARYLRVAIRNFDPRFSRAADFNTAKFNSLNLQPKDLEKPVAIDLHEFTVPEWWVAQYNLPRELAQPDLGNAIAFSVYLQGEPSGTDHDIQVDKVEFSGDWISTEYWYLGILCAWLIAATWYGASQWLRLRLQHAELQGEKDKYERLSTIDGLTKVLNRNGIEQFISSLQVANLPTSVIVIDLDHFKKINDHRGHYAGDRVLQTVGEILRAHTRNTDGLGRWGGEEFILVCPGATLSKAADLAEKLRQRIMQTNFIAEDPVTVTASFGVATSPAGGSFAEAFQQADQALYLAKSRGRNCVVCASEDQMHKVTGARKGTWALISGRFRLHK
ncbi:MAG TPA: GGDEF domain-containing protein [Povalibacter sp.]|nr:GGDEF domain-containing protein [Povalibacter sp.]